MKIKNICAKGMSILLSAMMVAFFIPAQAYAGTYEDDHVLQIWDQDYTFPDENKSVEVSAENTDATVTGGYISCDNADDALKVAAYEGHTADVTTGSLINSKEKGDDALFVATGNGSTTTVTINGNVECPDENYSVIYSINDSGEANITVNGNVNGNYEGIYSCDYGGNTNITVKGSINSNDEGIYDENYSGKTNITVNGSVNGNNDGIYTQNYDGETNITVNGSVNGQFYGMYAENCGGSTDYNVAGDVIAKYEGVSVYNYDYDVESGRRSELGTVNIRVNGTVSCDKKAGAGVVVYGDSQNINVTAWAITPNEAGRVAYTGDPDGGEAFEKSINYIIKVEQPEAGAVISASGETAHEGETVTLKVDVHNGWVVTGAYNGLDEPVELLQDKDGNYFVIVPKGGAVYLRVTTFAPERPVTGSSEESPANNCGDSLGATVAQMIMNAAPGATVTVNILTGTSLGKEIVDMLEVRKDVTLVVNYGFDNGIYSATIPANTDLTQYKNAVGGIDFTTLTTNFNGKQIY